ncbi:CotH kinase family protein [Paenibacillus sp. NEAU-GSW1]|uniref:CotH kinase family protein n=1 Tax=Paenibacillus sp. NEAU-GSW1 TaxID=2682486 RepID=UPI0012E18E0C|nr:CotH kinase family protein [Paenibacillus sp. NEAU-GSW1]MUT66918.1 spore coat protein CotH [Paenibacillus sp. NEAU-GSW1]
MKAKKGVAFLSLCSILIVAALSGCSSQTVSSGGETAGGASDAAGVQTASATVTGSTSKEEQFLDETVFPKDKVVDVKITIDEDEFQDMLDNASAEEMKPASVEYNGQKFDNVGIRTKGNLSLRSVVQMSDSDRYSFKISFDEYVNQQLGGISKINLNNNYSDASYMREFLSYELADSMGLPTPKFSYVNVYVNGELWGFYLAVEQIGDAYLERNFGNAYGALYKANGGNGSELNWLETLDSYAGLTLKSESDNGGVLLDMLDELNNGTDYESVLDVEEALKFIALNTVAGNSDSYLSQLKHNYYLYEDDGIFSVLPWDYNMSFGGFGGSGILIDEPTSGALADRPLIAKLLAVDEYKEKYHQIISDMLEGYLSEESFAERTEELKALISDYVKNDPSSFYTYEQYEEGVTQVISFNKTQTESIAKQLDGSSPSSGDGSGSGSMGGFGGMGGMGGMGMGGGNRGGQGQNGAQVGRGGNMGGAAPQGGQGSGNGAAAFDASQNGNVVLAAAAAEGQADAGSPAPATQGGAAEQGSDTAPNAQNGVPAQDDNAVQGGQGGRQMPEGMVPPEGNFGGMAPPEGDFQGGPGGFGGGGMQGGPGGGFGGFGNQTAQPQGSAKEAATAGIAAILLLASAAFIALYKRKRL